MDLQTVLTALRNADAAGDTQAAQRLARIAQSMQSSPQEDDIESRLKQLYAEREELIKPKTTFGGNIKEAFKGVVPGAIGLLETAGTGISSLLPDSTEKAAREKIREIAGIAKKPFEAAPGYEDSIGRNIGQGLGSTLPFFALGPLGLAGRATAGGLGVAAGAGEARESAEAKGATEEERRAATLLGAPTGLLDILAPQIKPFKSLMGTALVRGGVEGATEAAQKIAQNLIAKGVYDPQQEILVGSGEEGAYGAGVGALTSLIIDMTIGRKARRAQLGLDKQTPPSAKTPEEQLLLGYSAEPFTPIVAPDGSVITSKAELDAYQNSKGRAARQREADLRTSDPLAGLSTFDQNLARRGKEAALTETFGQEQEPGQFGLPGIERADGTVEIPGRGRVAGAPVTEEAINEPATERDTQTRDMIDELESQQIEEMQQADERDTAQVAAKKERLKFESDLAELTGRVENKQTKTTEDKRLQLLLPIVESDISNIPKAFDNALRAEGITDLEFTDREKKLIQRAYDLRLAEPDVTTEPTIEQPKGQTDELESLVSEKKPQRAQEQIGFPGMGKPKGAAPAPQAFSEEELKAQEEQAKRPFSPVIDAETLALAGLPKQSGFYKQLLNMDMSDPAQQSTVAHVFTRVRTNPNLSAHTKASIENLAMRAFNGLGKQGELFGPRGGVNKPEGSKKNETPTKPSAKSGDGRRDKNAGNVGGGTGTRTENRKESNTKDERAGAPADTARAEAPKSTGLGDSGKPAGDTGSRTDVEPGALKKTDPLAKYENLTGATRESAIRGEIALNNKVIAKAREKGEKTLAAKLEAENKQLEDLLGEAKTRDSKDRRASIDRQILKQSKSELDTAVANGELSQAEADNLVEEGRRTGNVSAAADKILSGVDKTEPKKQLTSREILDRAEEAQRKADEEAKAKKTEGKPQPTSKATGAYGQIAEVDRSKAIQYLAYDAYIAMFEKHKLLNRINRLNDIIAQLSSGQTPDIAFGREGTTSIVPLSGGKYAKTFYESLSAKDKAEFLKHLETYFTTSEAAVRRGTTLFTTQQELSRAVKEQMDIDEKNITLDAVTLGMQLHPAIHDALAAGDLVGALRMLGSQGLGRASEVAKNVLNAIGKTKVEVVKDLKNAEGKPVAGLYDPKTNTIKLNAGDGVNVHVLLHEAVHAATSHVIANKSHPLTKQLTELYNNVKGSLDTAYGAESLDEFVAEAFSNPEFQQKLAALNPKGEAITAWQRFTHAVRNFVRSLMGKGTKGMGTALDASDSLINAILSPAPESRGAGSLYSASMLGKSSSVFSALDDRILSMPIMNNKIAGDIYELFREGVPSAVKKLVLRGLPLNALTEVAAKDIPMAPKLDELEKMWSGAIDKRRSAAEATMTNIQRWIKGNPEKEVALNSVIADSTLEQVDPSKPRADYKGKQSESGTDKQVVWDKLQSQWKALNPEGQIIYKQMRDTYVKMHQDLLDLLLDRIDASVTNKEDAKNLKIEIYKRLATKGKIEPYFPLTRYGDYRLAYDVKSNGEHYVEHYETSVERELAIKELEKNGTAKNISRFSSSGTQSYKNAPPTSFVNSVLRTLEANKVNPEVTDEIMRMFLDTLPESSFAQAFRKRKNTPGFSFDATTAFYKRSMGMAHQLANFEYGAKMYKLRDEIEEHVKKNNNTERANLMKDELKSHIQTLIKPDIPSWSKALTSTAFGWTLGFNVSSAIVNMSQVPLVMMPYLGGKYGYSETAKAIGSATRLFFGSGLKRNAKMSVPTADGKSKIEISAGFSLDNYNFDAKGVPADVKRLKELAEIAENYGLLSRSMTSDILEMDKNSNALDRVNAWSGFVFHHGERMNRQVSLIAAYNLELGRMEKDGKKIDSAARTEAAKYAVQTTELMNGGASAGSAPLLAKSGIGKVVFMYKRYGATMYYMMFKTAREAMKSEEPEVRKAAMRQIAGIYASAGLMAGVQGLPMFGIMATIYNLFKDDDEDDMETAARKWLGEGMFNGAVNYLTGTAVANRIGLSDLLINNTGYKDQDNAVLAAMQLIGGPVFGVADRMQQGVKLIMEGDTERGLERMLPAGIANGLKGIRFATEGANTLRGDPIVGDVSAWNAGAQMFGFAPAEYTRQLEINAHEKTKDRRATQNRTKVLRDYYIASRNGDSDGMSDAIDDMMKFNKAHPGFAITAKTIQNSMAQHRKTSQEMYHGVTLSKGMRSELLQDAAEFDED